jgi:hypothetical protein
MKKVYKALILDRDEYMKMGKEYFYDEYPFNTYEMIFVDNNFRTASRGANSYELVYEKPKPKINVSVENTVGTSIPAPDILKEALESIIKRNTPKSKNKSRDDNYTFVVNRPDQIDIERIVKDVKKDNPTALGFILNINHVEHATVCIFPNIVDRFLTEDKFMIGGRYINKDWGTWTNSIIVKTDIFGKYFISPSISTSIVEEHLINENLIKTIPISKSEIKETIATLKAMKDYKRKIKVRVRVV